MSNKRVAKFAVGVSHEGNSLRVVKIQHSNDGVKILDLRHYRLRASTLKVAETRHEPSHTIERQSIDIIAGEEQNFTEESASVFDSDNGTTALVDIIAMVADRKTRIGFSVGEPQVFYNTFDTDWDLSGNKLLKKVQQEFLTNNEELSEVPRDSVDFARLAEGKVLGIIRSGELPLFNILNEAQKLTHKRFPQIAFVESADLSLVNLVVDTYDPAEETITLILHVTSEHSRFIFLRGREILHISSIIGEGADTAGAMSTLYSRLLYDLDTLDLPRIDRVVLTGQAYELGLHEYFNSDVQEYFDSNFSLGVKEYLTDGSGKSVPVEQVSFNSFNLSELENVKSDSLGPYSTALGAALRAMEPDRCVCQINLTPVIVRESQNRLMISTPGWILLGLIPVIIAFSLVRQHRMALDLNGMKNTLKNKQEITLRVAEIEEQIEVQQNILAEYEKSLAIVDSLFSGTDKFGSFIEKLMRLSEETWGIWFTDFNASEGDKVVMQGYSISRSKIPEFVDKLGNAKLNTVEVQEIRERRVYRFEIEAELIPKSGS